MHRKTLQPIRLTLISAAVSVLAACHAEGQGTPPDWWGRRGVLTADAANDFAALNAGQLKHLAHMAWLEMEEALPGGAGFEPAFTNAGNDYAAVNIGQLKEIARPFCDRMGLSGCYPWVGGAPAADDHALANIGQAKHLFSFDPQDADFDGDGMPDVWEALHGLDRFDPADADGDMDGDGLTNAGEFGMGTDPSKADTDGDGMDDFTEILHGFDPAVADTGFPDTDGDGLNDFEELIWGTDPDEADTDGDGLDDYFEIYENIGHGHTNYLANGVVFLGTDPINPDSDGDGLDDGREFALGTDPWNPDTDGDGLWDGQEADTYYPFTWQTTVADDRLFPITNVISLSSQSYVNDTVALLLQGEGVARAQRLTPAYYRESPPFASNAVCCAIGYQHVSAGLSDGRFVSWRYYSDGPTVTLLDLLQFETPVKDVVCGYDHTTALLEDGTVHTRYYGSDAAKSYSFTNQPPGLTGVVAIAAGFNHSVAVLSDGRVKAWGAPQNYGVTNVPPSAMNAVAISCGYHHSAALQRDGRVVVWGVGGYSELADNAASVSNAVEVVCGSDNCAAILEGRTNIVAWGDSFNASYYDRAATNISFSSPVRTVRLGYHGAAILEDGHAVMLKMRQPAYLRVKDIALAAHSACALAATDPLNPDTDGDGLPDGWELKFGFNPLSARERANEGSTWWVDMDCYDPDRDGLTNLEEYELGTDPTSPDVDGDGLWDIEEIEAGTDPWNPDTDGDGLLDGEEVHLYGTDPNKWDTDGDGVSDGEEAFLYETSPTLPQGVGIAAPFPFSHLLPEWLTCDLGMPAVPGTVSFSAGIFELAGGSGETQAYDRGRLCFLPAWGNFEFTARLQSVGAGGTAGIFIRRSESPDAVKVELEADTAGSLTSLTRQVPNGIGISSNHVATPGAVWLRLRRSGSPSCAGTLYTLSYSANGTSWTYPRTVTLETMGAKALVGLFVCGGQSGEPCSAVFTDVSITYADTGFAPFTLEPCTGSVFTGSSVTAIQPLVTGLTFQVSTTTNYSFSWSSQLVSGMEPFAVTSTAPAFVRVRATGRSGRLTSTFSSRFATDRHLNGWLAYYTPFPGDGWPTNMETNAVWVSHVLSADLGEDTRTPENIRKSPHVVRLKTTLATPYTLYGSSRLIFRLEYIGAVKGELIAPGYATRSLFDYPETATWTTRVFTNDYMYAGLNTLNIDLRSRSGTPGVRLWWRSEYEPEFKRILLTDCFVADFNQNGTADDSREWFGSGTMFTPDANSGLDSDGDGYCDFDEMTVFRSNPFDASSGPVAPVPDLNPATLVPGLVVRGFRNTGIPYVRLYDAPFANSVTRHTGSVYFTTDAAFAPLLPVGSPPVCGLVLEGFFAAEADGWYDFNLAADDRAVLDITGVSSAVVAFPGGKIVGAYLLAGCHPIRIAYENRDSTRSLSLSYRAPGASAFSLVPGNLLRSLADSFLSAQSLLDTDGDGIPDSLDGNPTMPDLGVDTDGDGVPDAEEREWAMTDPFVADISNEIIWQTVVPGETGTAVSGEWFADTGGIYCASRNGSAVFSFTIPSNGVYRIELYGRENSEYAENQPFNMELSVDGVSCGQQTFSSPNKTTGTARFYTSFLAAGSHTAIVRWINTLERHSLLIESLIVALPDGSDTDTDGIADWMTAFAAEFSAVSVPPVSHTSPVCLEGSHAGTMDALLLDGYPVPEDTPLWVPTRKRLPGNAWYADIPLASNGVTRITSGFEGASAVSTNPVEWAALNLAACRELTMRRGDTLKFMFEPVGDHPVMLSAATNAITFKVSVGVSGEDTVELVTVSASAPVFHTFDTTGVYTLRALWDNGAETYMFETHVSVIGTSFPGAPVLLLPGQKTRWQIEGLSQEPWLDHDAHLTLARDNGGTFLWATLLNDRTAYVSARLHESGPVLASAHAGAFSFTSHNAAGYMRYLYTLPDGTRVFEGRVSVEKLTPDLTLTVRFLSAQNYFANGLQSMTYTADDFDENGELVITMFVTGSSFCHTQTFSQGGTVITTY